MHSVDDAFARAKAHLDRGDYDQVIATCTEAIQLDPNAAWAFLYRGVAHDFKAGRSLFGDVSPAAIPRESHPHDYQATAELAIADFTEAIRLNPRDAIAYGNRGNDYLATGRYQEAIADYSEAIRLDPANSARYAARARAYQRTDLERSCADFKEAIRLDPNDPDHGVSQVNMVGRSGRWHQVITELTQEIERDPSDALAYALRATAHNGMGRWDRGIPDADVAIRLNPQLFLGFSARGYGYLQRGRPLPGGRTPTGCMTFLFTIAVGAIPGLGLGYLIAHVHGGPALLPMLPVITSILGGLVSWFFLGFRPALARQKQDLMQSVDDFTKSIELRPTDVSSYGGRAMAYRALGDIASAAKDEANMRTTKTIQPYS